MKTQLIATVPKMLEFGAMIGSLLRGGECLELVGDVGTGKTTFTKGVGAGLLVDDDIQSPSFTISRLYPVRDGLSLAHYDFYRLAEPGVMSYELAESLADPHTITVVEWAQTVADVLPADRIRLEFKYQATTEGRIVEMTLPPRYAYLSEVNQ